jgi:hypothetical protein
MARAWRLFLTVRPSLFRVLVDIRAARGVAAAHHIDGGFLAAHQLSEHLVDQTFFQQGQQAFWRFHASAG